jgi:outer membrane biosynthesis protein TonB
MGKLLSILGVSEENQKRLPDVVFKAEQVIDGLQRIYAQSPDSPKKEQLAVAITEAVKVLLAKVQPYMVDEKKEEKIEEEDKKLPQEDEQPKKPEAPKEQKPQRKQKPEPPQQTPEPPSAPEPPAPEPEGPEPEKPQVEEVMTCDEIKDAIKGLNLIAKMGDTEAKDIIKQLKIKLKNQNCK